MMHSSLPPSPNTASSIYEAIKDGDWEGLLSLYATTAYDAVHSAEFARQGGLGFHNRRHYQHYSSSSPPSLRASMAGGSGSGRGVFRDEKKMEAAPRTTSSRQGYNNNKSTTHIETSQSSSSPTIRDLDLIVREIIGADIFDEHRQQGREGDIIVNHQSSSHHGSYCYDNVNEPDGDCQNSKQPHAAQGRGQPNKKTRQHSPARKTPAAGGLLDHILFNPSSSSPSTTNNGRREKETDWEKVLWESASVLSNGRPANAFVVDRQDRDSRRSSSSSSSSSSSGDENNLKRENSKGALKSVLQGVDDNRQAKPNADGETTTTSTDDNSVPIFEGNVANATPGDLREGGTGSGTAQHLACLLDSPFALAVLIAFGANVEARHTAFRRLAVHEAACADSPGCLELLMEVGARFSVELFFPGDSNAMMGVASPAAAATSSVATSGEGLRSSSAKAGGAPSPSFDANSATGFDSLGSGNEYFSSETDERNNDNTAGRRSSKKKLGIFGWNKGKTPGMNGAASLLKKSPSDGNEFTPFPAALKAMWEAAKFLRSGDMTEMDAAHYVLDRVKVSNRAKMVLALQCPHIPSVMKHSSDDKASSTSFASIVNQLFQPNHRDMQSAFIKRNVDGHGNTPLHWAAFKNSVRSMDVLLSYNVDVNSRAQPSGWTPLHDAAYSDAADAVQRLIAAGALVDSRSHSGATPLCFAAQEDAPNATRMLLKAGADPSMRCMGNSPGNHVRANNADNNQFHSRFSGYTPLHYCAHYNAAKAARVLMYEIRSHHHHLYAVDLLEIPDLNEKLPIHVAVARGSSAVLRELLHGGARVETSSYHPPSPKAGDVVAQMAAPAVPMAAELTAPVAIPRNNDDAGNNGDEAAANTNTDGELSTSLSNVITPVSSPILRSMIPAQPITSSKPWNCLSQRSIDACKHLIEEVEMNWTPERHDLFSPSDRVAVVEVLRVGKRMEQVGRGIFLDLWPHVLSFCGRGWFEPLEGKGEGHEEEGKVSAKAIMQEEYCENEDDISMQCSSASSSDESSRGDMEESFTQFQLDETDEVMAVIL